VTLGPAATFTQEANFDVFAPSSYRQSDALEPDGATLLRFLGDHELFWQVTENVSGGAFLRWDTVVYVDDSDQSTFDTEFLITKRILNWQTQTFELSLDSSEIGLASTMQQEARSDGNIRSGTRLWTKPFDFNVRARLRNDEHIFIKHALQWQSLSSLIANWITSYSARFLIGGKF